MGGSRSVLCGLLCVGLAWAGGDRDKPVGNKPGDKPTASSAQIDLATSPSGKPRVDFAHVPLSFEPNLGQAIPVHASSRKVPATPCSSTRQERSSS